MFHLTKLVRLMTFCLKLMKMSNYQKFFYNEHSKLWMFSFALHGRLLLLFIVLELKNCDIYIFAIKKIYENTFS
jgi:hypothetical protein